MSELSWLRRAVRFRRRTVVLAAALVLGVGLVLMVLDRPTPAAWSYNGTGSAAVASVLTFNILTGGAPAEDALAAIAAAAPDIVCLQELTPKLAQSFVQRLGDTYPHRVFEPRRHTQGIGIASRFPLADTRILTLGLRYLPVAAAHVNLAGDRVNLACVHFIPPHSGFGQTDDLVRLYEDNRSIRVGQARRLLEHMDGAGGPAIVLGDFNEWPGQAALEALSASGFKDACHARRSRCGPTWPGHVVPLPALFRVDHILGRGVAFTDAAVLQAGGSDHYPVAARFRIAPEPAQARPQ
jgi:endonuclease/exonuclease/phosphatase (EEP) superfamily protein YafD